MRWWAEQAMLPDGVASRVQIVADAGVITSVQAGVPAGDELRLPGLVIPGLANAHSHAFHRALRGRTPAGGTFWTWREQMYAVAQRLDPDGYFALARATYAEMALAGITAVGEFHYLHHGPGGARYDGPWMEQALVAAAAEAGVRLTLLDAAYLAGGLDANGPLPLTPEQARFGDGDAAGWAARHDQVAALAGGPVVVGAAIHSVRAVPASAFPILAAGGPLHVHLSEQPAENQACEAAYGCTPTQLLADHGVLGPQTTAVHAIHLTGADIALLGGSGTGVCACPVTEADLADGIGPFPELAAAGSPISLGTDQHVSSDILIEAQRLDAHERLRSGVRGGFGPADLLRFATSNGHRALGQPGGVIAVGAAADLVALDLGGVTVAGIDAVQAVQVATGAQVREVIVAGVAVVSGGEHRLGDVADLLRCAVEPLWEAP